jgi:hypothetical protein
VGNSGSSTGSPPTCAQPSPRCAGCPEATLNYMRQMAAAWPEVAIGQQAVGQLPWGHVTVLLDKLGDQAQRDWYAAAAVQHGWSRNVLLHQIMNRVLERTGAAPPTSPPSSPEPTQSSRSN